VGQLGNNSTTESSTPVLVSGGTTYTTVIAGTHFTCALANTGLAHCWGLNENGQLGDGTSTDRLVPVPAAGGVSYTQIEAGGAALSPGSEIVRISSEPLLDHLQDIADTLTAAVTEVLTRTVTPLDQVEGTLNWVDGAATSTERSILQVLEDVSSAVLGEARQVLGTTTPELEAILVSLDSVTRNLNFFVGRITERPLRRTR